MDNKKESFICRLCLQNSEFKFSLFTADLTLKIESLTSIKVTEDDGLPSTCCELCVANVYTSYKFQQCIIQSDKVLRDKLIHTNCIEDAKKEPDIFEVLYVDGTEKYQELSVDELKQEHVDLIDERLVKSENESDNYSDSENVDSVTNILQNILDESGSCSIENDLSNNLLVDRVKENNEQAVNNLSKSVENILENDQDGSDKSDENGVETSNISSDAEALLSSLGIIDKFGKKLALYQNKRNAKPVVLECKDCNIKFTTRRSCQLHMMKHKIDTCPFCSISMRSDNLKRHIRIHTDSPEVCEICGKVAKNKESLRGHINYEHKTDKTFRCEPCNRTFKSKQSRRAHIKKTHMGIRNHQCHICGKKFFTNCDLKKHITVTHGGARPYVCPYCKNGFSSPYARKIHVRQHTLETPYRCEICAAGFRQKVSLVTHMQSKHSVKYKETKNNSAEDT